MPLSWHQVRDEFDHDGSLRDIYVLNTTAAHWQRMFDWLRQSAYAVEFRRAGVPAILPATFNEAMAIAKTECALLSISLMSLNVHCHFFTPEEIELDVDPREIAGQTDLEALLAFMIGLSSATGQDAILTPENVSEIVIFRARPDSSDVEWTPFAGSQR